MGIQHAGGHGEPAAGVIKAQFADIIAGKGGVGGANGHEGRVDIRVDLVHGGTGGGAEGCEPVGAVIRPGLAKLLVFRGVEGGNKGLPVGPSAVLEAAYTALAEAGIVAAGGKMGEAAVIVHPDEIGACGGINAVFFPGVGEEFLRNGAGDGLDGAAVGIDHAGEMIKMDLLQPIEVEGGPDVDAGGASPGTNVLYAAGDDLCLTAAVVIGGTVGVHIVA